MHKEILAVLDVEGSYASRFTDYLTSRQENIFQMYAFTDLEALKTFAARQHIKVLLVSEKMFCEEVQNIAAEQIMILTEDGKVKTDDRYRMIEKYQPAEGVLREVMEYTACQQYVDIRQKMAVQNIQIVGIYSPVKRCRKTTFALTLCHMLSKKLKVLYLNLEEYSGLQKIFKEEFVGDLSDLIYFYTQNSSVLQQKFYAVQKEYGGFFYIPPMMFSSDLRNIEMEVWCGFLEEIKTYELYDIVVLDLSDMVKDVTELLRICDNIYMPVLEDCVSIAKAEEFEQVLRDRHEDDIRNRIQRFVMEVEDSDEKRIYDVNKIMNGSFQNFVRNVTGGIEDWCR